MATAKLARLVDIYQQELDRFCRMRALAAEQAQCVAASNFTVLNRILERRQDLAEEIGGLSQQAQAVAQQLAADLGLPETNVSNLRQKLPEAAVAPLEQVLAQLGQVAEAIQEIDKESEAELRRAMQGLRGEMSNVQRGQTAMRAYKNAPQPNAARFLDEKK
ncbi:MAG: hypothetical protein GX033_09545 [Firmicutes bacterium]|nr:hypothetical protein [Bacillota bacterium]